MFQKPKDTLQLIVHESDIPTMKKGGLIPRLQKRRPAPSRIPPAKVPTPAQLTPTSVMAAVPAPTSWLMVFGRAMVTAMVCVAVFGAATVGLGVVEDQGQVAAPILSVVDPNTLNVTPLDYGPQQALAQTNFYLETRDALIADAVTFVEIDVAREELRFFDEGVLRLSSDVLSTGADGSWWDAPAGLYEISGREREYFSEIAQVQFPFAIQFEENYLIHGTPTFPDGREVADADTVGGIQIPNETAEELYQALSTDVPILIHVPTEAVDTFVYEPPAPAITAPNYFVADISTGAILASDNSNEAAPIASITKLMTAVVAAEELSLDSRVQTASTSFVASLIPRLESRSSVSMYSLLQLLLVESSNEAAEVIASQIGRAEFVEGMNTKARRLGMLDTTFADPSGVSPDNQSTVSDLYRLTQYIAKNRSFIFDVTKDVSLPSAYQGGEFGGLINFNEIDGVNGFVGGKVGETRAAGQTSISLHELELSGTTRTVVVILLGSESRTRDVQTLVSFVEQQFGS